MTDPTDERPFSYVKHLGEIRDRIGKERAHMTPDEIAQWRQSREYKHPKLRRLMSRARPPKPPRSKHGTARALGLMPYPKYRPSGVEWLGEVPEHWQMRRLKSVARRPIENGLGEAAIHDDRDWPRYIRITDIASSRQLRVDTFKSLPPVLAAKATVEAHDILFAAVGATFGKSYYHVSRETPFACYAGYLVRFSPDVNQVFPAFVAYWAESHAYWALIRSRVIQATIENFSATKYKNLTAPVPPISEQQAIAKYLDRETAKIDALIRKKETLVEMLEEYRTALISRTVTRGLPPDEARKAGFDPHPKLRPSGVEWLGEVPEHWETRRLKHVCRLAYGQSLASHDRHGEGDVPVYGSNGLVGFHSTANANGPCVIVGRKGSFGKIHYSATSSFTIDTTYFVDRRHTDADMRWLYYVLGLMQLDKVSKDSAIPGLGRTDAYSRSCLYPPTSEQRAIARYLDRETTKIDRITELARQGIDLLYEYRTRLISDVVTGKVDVRGIGGRDLGATA